MAGDPADESAVRALVKSGVISEIQFARAVAAQANLPFVELIDYPVDRARGLARAGRGLPPSQRAPAPNRRRPPRARHGRPGQRLRHRRRARGGPDARGPGRRRTLRPARRPGPLPSGRRRTQRPDLHAGGGERGGREFLVRARRLHRRRRPDRALRQPAGQPGHPGPGLRHPHRAGRARPARALPHRRRAARDADARRRASRTA